MPDLSQARKDSSSQFVPGNNMTATVGLILMEVF